MADPSSDNKESPLWAVGFERPLDSDEEGTMEKEDKKGRGEEKAFKTSQPGKRADTIRGTPTVKQPGPNLAEKTQKEMSKEFSDGMKEAEEAMKRDLESKKYTREQIDEIKALMEKSVSLSLKTAIKKMKIGMEEEEDEMTEEQLKVKVQELQRKLDENEQKDDETTALMLTLQGQLQQAEIAKAAERAAKEKLQVDFQKQYDEAMSKVDAARNELREKKAKSEAEKEAEKRRQETRKHEKDIRERDNKIRLLQQELKDKQGKLSRAEAERKEEKQKEKKQIEELTTSLKDAQHKLDLEEARYQEGDKAKDEIKRLKEQVETLENELLAVEEQNLQLMGDLEAIEKALDEANKNDALIAELNTKVAAYENEDKGYILRIGSLEYERKNLSLQLVNHKREIQAKNKTIETQTVALTEAGERIVQLEAAVGADILEIKEENKKLLEENHQLRKQLKDLENPGDEIARLGEQLSASQAALLASKQEINRLEGQLASIRQLKSNEEEKAMTGRRQQEQRMEEALSKIRRLEQIVKADPKPDQTELIDLRGRVQNCDTEKDKLRERILHLEQEIEGTQKLIDKLTVEHQGLLSTNESLEKNLSESVLSEKKLQRSLKEEKEKAKAEAGLGAGTQDGQALNARIAALEKENQKLRKKDDRSEVGVDESSWEFTALKAHSSLYVVEILMGFLVLRRARNGMVPNDIEDVEAAMVIALEESGKTNDAELIAEVTWWGAIVDYYGGNTPKALEGFERALAADLWEIKEKNNLEEWVRECSIKTRLDCPTGRSGYREALGFGPGPGTLKAPLKLSSDEELEEEKKNRKEARKIKKEAKKIKKEAKKVAKEAKKAQKATKPRRAPAPRRRGVRRRDLYVGILSPKQQMIWDTIDFNKFDYDKLTSEQQSLFSFEPFEDEPDSPVGGAPPPPRESPPPHESPPRPLPPLPESPPESPGRDERMRTPSSAASSAASIVAEGNQIRRPSRMDDLTTNAALHIQWLTARLANREARIRELESIHGDVLIVRAQLHRREGQIQELRNHANIMIAELTLWRRTAREERRRLREEQNRGWWAWTPL
ncbi:hypothetical protein EYC84_000966 [Monilinia fructicola]|uniref:Uncharacterized protein n=1 Tax=Monilinia fructicola TaxID=38448 RepID=A0A5M9JMU8_MONFR|nr:hypothetical protein EYC84_000966 [Monilinia fructicola]